METQKTERHIGRKIWYGTAIVLSSLILLLSVGGIIGTWAVQSAISNITITLLGAVDTAAGGIREVTATVDEGVGEIAAISTEVSDISAQIAGNIEDQGLIATLLPEEQKQKLGETIDSIAETLETIAEVVTAGLDIYTSIDQLPFIDLPKPSAAKMDEMQQSVAKTQAEIDQLQQDIQDFRSGAASEVSKVTEAADNVTEAMDTLSSDLSALDSDLAAVQETSRQLQGTIPTLFAIGALLISLLLLYGAYVQVEMIRLLVHRWRALNQPADEMVIEGEAVDALPEEAADEQGEEAKAPEGGSDEVEEAEDEARDTETEAGDVEGEQT